MLDTRKAYVAPILHHESPRDKGLFEKIRSRFCDDKALAWLRHCDYILETETKEADMGQGYDLFKARVAVQAPIVVFDLDGTVICSQHRHLSKPDGSLDLEHWIANCTPEKIFADRLLPLARSMRAMHKAGHHIVICTARVMSEHDLAYLENNGLRFHGLLSRAEGDRRPDAEMKVCLLNKYLFDLGFASIREANCIMFEDNLTVIDAMVKQGVICINATKENARQVA
jgi:hypothetical protein